MKPEIGQKYLVTTCDWFMAPDGKQYKSAFGTLKGIYTDQETLGIKTNRGSTNWYLSLGNILIAGCQVFYCIKTSKVNTDPPLRDIEFEGKFYSPKSTLSRIYLADEIKIKKEKK